MNKAEYLQALRQELQGLPAEIVQDTLWTYEGKFVDALLHGKTEAEIADILPRPQLVAAQKRVKTQFAEVRTAFTPLNLLRFLFALFGLAIFNLLMLGPAIAYMVVLALTYLFSIGVFVAGIAMASIGFSGVAHYQIDLPSGHYHSHWSNQDIEPMQGRTIVVNIDPLDSQRHTDALVSTSTIAPSADVVSKVPDNVKGLHIKVENRLKVVHGVLGIFVVLLAISLLLLCMLITKYSFIGFAHYLRWNFSLLRLPPTTNR